MADYWRRNGYSVRFLYGTKTYVPADLCFVHVDLSIVPDQYLEFANRYPIVINGKINDIRKCKISSNQVQKASQYKGPVIVKSALNSAGRPERISDSSLVSLLFSKALRSSGLSRKSILEQSDYKVFNCVSEVPDEVFEDTRTIVEKFLPERDGDLYCVNFYKFLGDKHLVQKLWSKTPVITGTGLVKRETIELDPKMIAIRKALQLDYGKLDYCINHGKPTLLDVNKTIGLSRNRRTPQEIGLIHQQAQGIESFFD